MQERSGHFIEITQPLGEDFAYIEHRKNSAGEVKWTAPICLSDQSRILFVESTVFARTAQNRMGEISHLPETKTLFAYILNEVSGENPQSVGYACVVLSENSAEMTIYNLNSQLVGLLPDDIQFCAEKTDVLHAVKIEDQFRGKGHFKKLMLILLLNLYLTGRKELIVKGDLNIGLGDDGEPTSPFLSIGAQLIPDTVGTKCYFDIASVLEKNKERIANYLQSE